MARKSKTLGTLLSADNFLEVWENLKSKEQARVYKEIVRETNRALKTATTYTVQQFQKRAKRGKKAAKIYKTEKRALQEIGRSLTVLRTEASLKELKKNREFSKKEESWESMQEDNYFIEWVKEFAIEAKMNIPKEEIDKMFDAYNALKGELHARTYNEYYKLAKEVFTVWKSGQKENWDSIRTQIYNQWAAGAFTLDDRNASDMEDVF